MKKKGASAVVAWVLLLGFSIGLATTIFLWTTRQTEEMSESAVRFVEGGMQCDNVMINVAKTPVTCTPLIITNTRYLNIEKILLRQISNPAPNPIYCQGGEKFKVKDPAMPCPETTEPTGWTGKIEVMPLIKIDNDLVACKNKAITVEC
ncbi:MAG: hypothetical protein Q8N77_01180 [Nanoarchaeota archaeon]|nr:hypothetical protein [Nanoarchaeota archaeon]